MNIPGFTAEASLYKTHSQYHIAIRGRLNDTNRDKIALQSLPSSVFEYRSRHLPPSILLYCRCRWIVTDVIITPEPPFYRVIMDLFCSCG
jgi:hypothetical protein